MSLRAHLNVSGHFRPDPVIRQNERVFRRFLFQSGGLVRKIAQRSLRRARKIRVSELPDDAAEEYREQLEDYQNGHRDRPPVLRDIISDPGSPPLLHQNRSPLKRLLRFFVDEKKGFVVIGPEKSNDAIAGDLEHATGDIKQARPFMGPAFQKALPKLPGYLKSAANR